MQFSQSFLDEIIKCLCSLESPFQVVLKNSLSFYDRTYMTKVMADVMSLDLSLTIYGLINRVASFREELISCNIQ